MKRSRAREAALLASLTAVFSCVIAASLKAGGGELPAVQVAFVRFAVGAVVLRAVARAAASPTTGAGPKSRPVLHLLRAALGVAAFASFVLTAPRLPLTSWYAVQFAHPVFLVLFGRVVLGESVPRLRLVAIALGFTGVLVAVKPERPDDTLTLAVLVCGVASAAAGDVVVRILARSEPPGLIVAKFFSIASSALAIPALYGWSAPSGRGYAVLAAVTVFGLASQSALTRALALAPVAVTAPFVYLSLPISAAVGYGVWGETPGGREVAGMSLIVLEGVLTAVSLRESNHRPRGGGRSLPDDGRPHDPSHEPDPRPARQESESEA